MFFYHIKHLQRQLQFNQIFFSVVFCQQKYAEKKLFKLLCFKKVQNTIFHNFPRSESEPQTNPLENSRSEFRFSKAEWEPR